MLNPWLEFPGVADHLGSFSQLGSFSSSDLDLRALGTDADAEAIRDTRVAQPLIVASSLIALRVILDGRDARDVVDVTAGHSVGEFAAAATAGVLDDASAVALVSQRASFMADAAAANPSGMSAVLGGDPGEVLAAVESAGLWPANVNGGGQIVAAGSLERLAALAENPPAKARIIPLKVTGAFHTPLMDSAAASFAPVAARWAANDPQLPFLSNADGASYEAIGQPSDVEPFGSKAAVLKRLAQQITTPVRWDLCQETLAARGVTALLELMPGGVLTGLARRALPGVETVAVKSPADIDAARDLITRHSGTTIAPAEDPT
jgi:[acyl-carrier-protein] S-malonyltransferase